MTRITPTSAKTSIFHLQQFCGCQQVVPTSLEILKFCREFRWFRTPGLGYIISQPTELTNYTDTVITWIIGNVLQCLEPWVSNMTHVPGAAEFQHLISHRRQNTVHLTLDSPYLHNDGCWQWLTMWSDNPFPRLFTVTSEHIRLFYFLVFFLFLHFFSCRFRAVD